VFKFTLYIFIKNKDIKSKEGSQFILTTKNSNFHGSSLLFPVAVL